MVQTIDGQGDNVSEWYGPSLCSCSGRPLVLFARDRLSRRSGDLMRLRISPALAEK